MRDRVNLPAFIKLEKFRFYQTKCSSPLKLRLKNKENEISHNYNYTSSIWADLTERKLNIKNFMCFKILNLDKLYYKVI